MRITAPLEPTNGNLQTFTVTYPQVIKGKVTVQELRLTCAQAKRDLASAGLKAHTLDCTPSTSVTRFDISVYGTAKNFDQIKTTIETTFAAGAYVDELNAVDSATV